VRNKIRNQKAETRKEDEKAGGQGGNSGAD
jgi:hypothetical protein